MARVKPGRRLAPQGRESLDQAEPDAELAPDVALSVLDFVRTRRCVKVAVVYLAVGWALLEFASFAMQGRPGAGLVRDMALVLYLCGFFIVLTGAYLVMSGKHPLRTVMIAGLVSASALAGAGIAIVGYQYRGASPEAPEVDGVAASQSAPSAQASTAAASPSAPPSAVPSLTDVPANPGPAGPPRAESTPSVDAAEDRLARLVLRFGERDERELTLGDTRPVPFLDRYDEPVAIRLIPGIRVQVTNPFDQRIQALRLTNPGDVGTHRVVVPSGCGELPYDVTVTVLTRQQVRVRVQLDRDAARAAVERTVELGRCVGLD
jgi:hypothetical protein